VPVNTNPKRERGAGLPSLALRVSVEGYFCHASLSSASARTLPDNL